MKITYLGGAETVTGSKFLVQTDSTSILVDCGLFQGYKWLRERNREAPPLDVERLDAVVLSHAHLDHSGYIPVLKKLGFRGPVFTHHASRELCGILLPDSGHIQEEDARYHAKHRIGKHANPEPLYTKQEAVAAMDLFEPVDFREEFNISDIRVQLQSAGHILGAGSVLLEAEGQRIGFSGDVGRPDDIFMRSPDILPSLDLLMLESTYGNRLHETSDPFEQLATHVNATVQAGGVVLVPSFAVGRAQVLMHMLAVLMAEGRIPQLPVFLDSPMAIDVSDIYCRYGDQHKLNMDQCKAMCSGVTYTHSVEESKGLAELNGPHVIIAGSGMASGGRILHHMKRLLGDHRTTVLFTGYQAGGTRGARMLAGADQVRIHGQPVRNRARVSVLDGLSGHADYQQMGDWLSQSALDKHARIRLVHGDADALEGMREHLQRVSDYRVEVATHREVFNL